MLSDMVRQFADEVNGADEYLKCAATDSQHAAMYAQMAQSEFEHAKMLRDAIDQECSKSRTPDEAKDCLDGILKAVRGMASDRMGALQARM